MAFFSRTPRESAHGVLGTKRAEIAVKIAFPSQQDMKNYLGFFFKSSITSRGRKRMLPPILKCGNADSFMRRASVDVEIPRNRASSFGAMGLSSGEIAGTGAAIWVGVGSGTAGAASPSTLEGVSGLRGRPLLLRICDDSATRTVYR